MILKSPSVRIWAVAIFLALGSCAGSLWQLYISHAVHLQAADRLSLSLAKAAANRLFGSLHAFDLLLAEAADRRPNPSQPDPNRFPALTGRGGGATGIDSLILVDADGIGRFQFRPDGTNRPLSTPMTDRPFVIYQHDHWQDGRLFIGKPIFERPGTKPVMHMSRPLISTEGRFLGSIVLVLHLDFIDQALMSVVPGEGGASGVFSPDGILYSRQPADDRFIGKSVAESGTFKAYVAVGGTGNARQAAASFSDGQNRILGFTPVPDFDLISIVGVNADRIMADWWREVWVHGSIQAVLASVILSMAALLIRSEHKTANVTRLLLASERAHVHSLEQAVAERTRELKETISALADGERRFRLIVEISPLPLMLVRMPSGTITFLNQRAAETLGLGDVTALPPQLSSFFPGTGEFADLLAQVERQGRILSQELHLVRLNGEGFTALVSIAPLTLAGEPMLLVGIQDITVQKALEDDLGRSNRDLEQFSYAVSHDLQEPLRMVSSYLGLLERRYGGELDETAREFIHYAVDGAKRMSRMITALLDYSRVHRRGNPFENVDLGECLNDALVNLDHAIQESGASLKTCPLPRVEGDSSQLMRVFQNLIGNAIKYRKADQPPEITLSANLDGTHWRICVTDNGIGINPDHAGRLFQVFQRLHTRDAYEGDGVGLAVCRRIIERHGGQIWMESQGDGTGTSFVFTLPAISDQLAR